MLIKLRSLLLLTLLAFIECRYVYIGTGQSPPQGIQIYQQNNDGTLSYAYTVPASPWFIALHPNGKYLYATGNNAYVSYTIQGNGNLTQLNSQPCGGDGPTHLSVHPSGNFLFGANYNDGTFVSFGIDSAGAITPIIDKQRPGTGLLAVPDRQDGPHAHMIATAPNASQVVGIDLGADKIFVFALDLKTGKLAPNRVPYGQVDSGSGSRHIAFHPKQQIAYVIGELRSSVHVFQYNPLTGAFVSIQTVSSLPENYNGVNTAAEIRVHPNGKWLYATNRGADTVAFFQLSNIGKIVSVDWISSHGSLPRGMNIDPEGNFLYVANQNGNNVVGYSINQTTGALRYISEVKIQIAVDVEFGI